MANVIYVGNYPTTYTDDNIMDIFIDFEGLVLLRSVKKIQKCYSFILCLNEEQVVDVVLALNGIFVDGRELIVRASDEELQGLIEECEEEEDFAEEDEIDSFPEESTNQGYYSHKKNYCDTDSQLSTYTNSCRQPRNPSRLVSLNDTSTPNSVPTWQKSNLTTKLSTPNYSNALTDKSRKVELSSNAESNFALATVGKKSADGVSYVDLKDVHLPSSHSKRNLEFEAASCASYSTNSRYSPGSTVSRYSKTDRRGERFCFVSVINFRNGTTEEELFELFADYRPYKIIIRTPKHHGDVPTEAVICFFKSKNATNAILNLDNTLHKGRVLLVMECDDLSYVSELLGVPLTK